jgi:hypothetical protein
VAAIYRFKEKSPPPQKIGEKSLGRVPLSGVYPLKAARPSRDDLLGLRNAKNTA